MKISTSIATGLLALSVTLGGLSTAAQAAPTPTPTPTGRSTPAPTATPAQNSTPQGRSAEASPAPKAQRAPAEDMMVPGPINDKWIEYGGVDGWNAIGHPRQWQYCPLVRGGCFQVFEKGNIYHLAATGTWSVRGPFLDRWGAWGWEAGELGYPEGDAGFYTGGSPLQWQSFEHGDILQDQSTSDTAYVLRGAIRDHWAHVPGGTKPNTGRYGYPTMDEVCGLRDRGCFQTFGDGGGNPGSIYFSPATGAHGVNGEIGRRWAEQRWETGALRYPTTDEFCQLRDSGCGQHFQGGSIYWSLNTGPRIVSGPIRDAYARDGWEAGRLGYPRGEVRMQGTGAGSYWIQDFQGGWISMRPDGTGLYVGHF